MNQQSIETRRGQLVVLLWSLKRYIDLYPNALGSAHFMNYRAALENEGYRQQLCDLALNSSNKKMQRLAKAIVRLDFGGSLAEIDQVNHHLPKPVLALINSYRRLKRRWSSASRLELEFERI